MEEEARLPTGLWVDAHLRRLTQEAVPYYVVNKGAYVSGTVLLKINTLEPDGCTVLSQQRDLYGKMGWMPVFSGGPVAESEADNYIRRALGRDPDLWVIEIEDREGKNPFEGEIF